MTSSKKVAARLKRNAKRRTGHYRYYIRVGGEVLRSGADGHKVWFQSRSEAHKRRRHLASMEPVPVKVVRTRVA